MKRPTISILLLFSTLSVGAVEPSDFYSLPVTGISGEKATLSELRGKVVLVVNTASRCGYTPQYNGLQELYRKYRDQGLVVLGFPSNDFGGQEPGSNGEIRRFCQLNYGVDFPLYSKASVTGADTQPVFKWLLEHAPTHEPVSWNFEKFLVDRNGQVTARFKSGVEPSAPLLTRKIEMALADRSPLAKEAPATSR